MSDTVITVESLGKLYRLGHLHSAKHLLFRDVVAQNFRAAGRWAWRRPASAIGAGEDREFWALRDLTFEVQRGEVLGIIGRNGAGKSTLLKILSRVTEPTRGRVRLRGRVGSLLEVGTGFHPELSGRENIFLNGAVLGMSRAEIKRKFDEIVNFADVERFLETPVKRYSSGMYVRLAFAVAAHLEPEILVIDEVLAVGDAEFQQKCLGKMRDVAEHGRTILFVSHNMAAVSALCHRVLLVESGTLRMQGDPGEVVMSYLSSDGSFHTTEWTGDEGDEFGRLQKTWIKSSDPSGAFHTAAELEIGIEVLLKERVQGLILGFRIVSEFGADLVYSLYDDAETGPAEIHEPGRIVKRFILPKDFLGEGNYQVKIAFGIHNRRIIVLGTHGTLAIRVENTRGIGRRHLGTRGVGFQSIVRPRLGVY